MKSQIKQDIDAFITLLPKKMDVFSEISSLMKETDVTVLSVRYDLMVNRITPFFTCNRNPGYFDKLNVFARDVNDLLGSLNTHYLLE